MAGAGAGFWACPATGAKTLTKKDAGGDPASRERRRVTNGLAELDAFGVGGADEGVGHVGGRDGNFDAALLEDFDFGRGCVFGSTDDGACVAHAATGGSGGSGDEAGDGFFAIFFDPACGLDLGVATDFADHDDTVSVRIFGEKLDDIEVRRAVDWIAADADRSALANTFGGELKDGFVGEGAGA